MRTSLMEMKHEIGFTAVLAALLVGMTIFAAGSAAAVPADNNAAVVAAAVMQPAVPAGADIVKAKSDFNPAFNRPFINPFFNRPEFVRPAFNPFFVRPAFNPFFARPLFNPFFGVDVDAFGAEFD